MINPFNNGENPKEQSWAEIKKIRALRNLFFLKVQRVGLKPSLLFLFTLVFLATAAIFSRLPFFCVNDYKVEGSFDLGDTRLIRQAIDLYREDRVVSCKVSRFRVERVSKDRVCLVAYENFLGTEREKKDRIIYIRGPIGQAKISFSEICD